MIQKSLYMINMVEGKKKGGEFSTYFFNTKPVWNVIVKNYSLWHHTHGFISMVIQLKASPNLSLELQICIQLSPGRLLRLKSNSFSASLWTDINVVLCLQHAVFTSFIINYGGLQSWKASTISSYLSVLMMSNYLHFINLLKMYFSDISSFLNHVPNFNPPLSLTITWHISWLLICPSLTRPLLHDQCCYSEMQICLYLSPLRDIHFP